MAMIISGKKTVYFNNTGFVKVDFNGQAMDLPIVGDFSIDVPFTKFVNLEELFLTNMAFYNRFCCVLKGITNNKERMVVSQEFLKNNILSYIPMETTDNNIEIHDINFIHSIGPTESTTILNKMMGSLKNEREQWLMELEAHRKFESEQKKLNQSRAKRKIEEKRRHIISSRVILNIKCMRGDQCWYSNPIQPNHKRPCRYLHPSDLV